MNQTIRLAVPSIPTGRGYIFIDPTQSQFLTGASIISFHMGHEHEHVVGLNFIFRTHGTLKAFTALNIIQ